MMFLKTLMFGLTFAASVSAACAQDTLRVGAYPANPPWEFKTETGAFQGYEVDIVNEIARRIGAEVEYQGLDFRALFVATASRRVDMVISSLTVTPERLQAQAFLQPYAAGALGIVTKAGSDIASEGDLAGKRVGSIATSFAETWVKEREAELKLGSYSSYDTIANMLTDLHSGRIEAALNDEVGLRYAVKQMPALQVAAVIPTGEEFAIMMPKGSDKVRVANDALTAMKQDGTMARIYETWFGTAPAADSLTVTPAPLPQAE